MNRVKVAGAPWLPPDPTGAGSNQDMGSGMMKSLASRRKNKMGALKHKMQAAAYGGDAESWIGIFEHYDSDGSGELDFDEFRKAIRRHGRMSIRSVTDGELKEVFAVVDTDCGGTVSAEEFQRFVDDPQMGTELKPALTCNYTKSANAIGIYDTRHGKGKGLATGEAPWAQRSSAPGYKRTAAGSKTEEDWEKNEAYQKMMHSQAPRRDVSTVAAALPTRFFTEGLKAGGFQRHNSASEMDKVWERQRRKKAHAVEKLTSVAFGGVKHRADGKTMAANNIAGEEAAALFAAYDVVRSLARFLSFLYPSACLLETPANGSPKVSSLTCCLCISGWRRQVHQR